MRSLPRMCVESFKTVTFPNATSASDAYDNARRLTALTNASSTATCSQVIWTRLRRGAERCR